MPFTQLTFILWFISKPLRSAITLVMTRVHCHFVGWATNRFLGHSGLGRCWDQANRFRLNRLFSLVGHINPCIFRRVYCFHVCSWIWIGSIFRGCSTFERWGIVLFHPEPCFALLSAFACLLPFWRAFSRDFMTFTLLFIRKSLLFPA